MGVFKVLMWKHYVVRKRRFLQTFIEFLSPFAMMLTLFVLKNLMQRKTGGSLIVLSDPFQVSNFSLNFESPPPQVIYSPETPVTKALMARVDKALGGGLVARLTESTKMCPYMNITTDYMDLVKKSRSTTSSGCALVEFEVTNDTMLPDVLNYTIRMNSLIPRRPFATYQRLFEKFENVPPSFLRLQWAIDKSYLNMRTNSTMDLKDITFEALFPNTERHTLNKVFLSTIFVLLPFISFIAPLFPFIFLMNRLLEERATGIQELVKMVGVTPTMLGIAQFVNSLPSCIIYCVGGTLLMKATNSPMVVATNGLILFLSQFLHFTTMIAMAFACSCISRDAQHTVSLSMFVYIGMWVPIRLIGHSNASDVALFFLGFLPHCPTYWFLGEAVVSEVRYETGIQFDSLTTRYSVMDDGVRNPPILVSFIMQLVQITYFFMLSWYFDKVRPGKYGIALPWNFFCQKEYWTKNKKPIPLTTSEATAPYDPAYQKYFEKPPENMEAGIKILHVSKIFGSGQKEFQALNNVTLNIYKGEITVLLGHNGAGKTTLMSIITGMISPTSGKVYVNGLDTVTQQAEVRKQMGLCPQHNLFFPDLTVLEHLLFFSMIKGASYDDARKSSDVLMKELCLTDHAYKKTAQLSGGMLRRLQLGCALCGNASVLILDEPTSGLDVEARRELWDMVLALRGNRTLVLTTHFMEEADVLGDRMAALHAGKLRCHATSMFLKRAIGSGFRIEITTANQSQEENITSAVVETEPEGILMEKSSNTLVYELPHNAKLSQFFKNIENKMEMLEIEAIGISITSLEEVFIKLCCDVETNKKTEIKDSRPLPRIQVTGLMQRLCQFKQLLARQFDFTMSKKWSFLLLQMLLPVILCTTLTKLFNNLDKSKNETLTLNLDMYTDMGLRRALYNISSETRRVNTLTAIQHVYPNIKFINLPIPSKIFTRRGSTVSNFKSNHSKCNIDYRKYLLGIELTDSHARVLYSPNVQHTAPVGLNLISNTLAMQEILHADGKVINTKLTNSVPLRSRYHIPKSRINCALFAIFNMCTVMATAINDVILPCKERLTVARHTHIMAGCPPVLYWLTTFLYHMTTYTCFYCTSCVVAAKFFDEDRTIDDKDTLLALFVVLLLSGMNFYSFSYFISFYFNEHGASLVLIAIIIIFGFLSPIIIVALDDLKETEEDHLYTRIMNIIGILIPSHLFAEAVIKVTDTSRFNSFCIHNLDKCPALEPLGEGFDHKLCCSKGTKVAGPFNHFSFSKYAVGYPLLLIGIQFVIFTILVLLLEYGVFNRCWNAIGKMRKLKYPTRKYNCQEVAAEKAYVDCTVQKQKKEIRDTMLLDKVWKAYYGLCREPTFALRDVNFSVKKGECFGVLGVNGAGKTTTFKVISGEESATRGRTYVDGHFNGSDKYLPSLGYCPQFSGLDDFRTGANNLRMLLSLRGLSKEEVRRETIAWLVVVGMEKYGNRIVAGYSGGMVRRLATAASLCGGAPVTLLDEPTAGVDTAARRLVWDALKRGLLHDRAIVISSHSMDEMEKLCKRVTILNSGEMSVLGNPLALRDAYAAGHAVVLKLNSKVVDSAVGGDKVLQLKAAFTQKFNCTLKDEHLTSLYFRINEKLLYSDIFAKMDAIVSECRDVVEDFSVSDTTLEDVFLTFANDMQSRHEKYD